MTDDTLQFLQMRRQVQSQSQSQSFGNTMTLPTQSSGMSDNDRSSGELRALDCNLGSLCDHIQMEGFNAGAFSDILVQAMGATYHLHRLILSRSSYFRNMLQGPWKEAGVPMVTLQIDDENVNEEAVAVALAYLYGHHPELKADNAFRVLAAASFFDLQDLCAICTAFIISELWTSNFLSYQAFAESQDYGIHGERVRTACWGYLCQSGTVELREILPKLSTQTLQTLLTSDELWVPSEEKRLELALSILLAKGALMENDTSQVPCIATSSSPSVNSAILSHSTLLDEDINEKSEYRQSFETEFRCFSSHENYEVLKTARNILVELADYAVDFHNNLCDSKSLVKIDQGVYSQQNAGAMYVYRSEKPGSLNKSQIEVDVSNRCKPLLEMRKTLESSTTGDANSGAEGSSKETLAGSSANHNKWLSRDQPHQCSSSQLSFSNRVLSNDWGRYVNCPSWGGRIVRKRQVKAAHKESGCSSSEDWHAFVSIFEGGCVLYCHMTFEELLNVRRQLEELGFPCKSVYDGLWLQMLLRHQVLSIAADTCKNCCLTSQACACRQPYGFSHGGTSSNFYRYDQDRNSSPGTVGSLYASDSPGRGNGSSVQVRMHVRGAVDGLAGIGRGTTFGPPDAAWPPTRFVFSRVPFGVGNRNSQQNLANDDSEGRVEHGGMDLPGDGLTALVGLSQGTGNGIPVHSDQTPRVYDQDLNSRRIGDTAAATSSSNIAMQRLDAEEQSLGQDWEYAEGSPIALDLQTPLRNFPPFRFGVEFEDVHRLNDGQVKHSHEVFYAGSLWKVSVQAFNDEDPQGRRTLGLFLHRRKAESLDPQRKVHPYTDAREKVTVRYQLICPSKREVMVFGSLTQAGTLLPKAPKGWGWRTALLFDELADLLQGGSLRVAAVVQLV
eukprot:Gb_33591 [translate_table: standard]